MIILFDEEESVECHFWPPDGWDGPMISRWLSDCLCDTLFSKTTLNFGMVEH